MNEQPFRTAPQVVFRCGRGHEHEERAEGAYCLIAPCTGYYGWYLELTKIERVVVEAA